MGMIPLVKGACPEAVAIEGLCIGGPKDGWTEWGHGEDKGGGGRGRAGDANKAAIANAKRICAKCPVLEACREWACNDPDPVPAMVAGGLTTAERRGWRKRNEPIRHGTPTGWRQHTHRGDPPCDPCVLARARYLRQIAILKKECA